MKTLIPHVLLALLAVVVAWPLSAVLLAGAQLLPVSAPGLGIAAVYLAALLARLLARGVVEAPETAGWLNWATLPYALLGVLGLSILCGVIAPLDDLPPLTPANLLAIALLGLLPAAHLAWMDRPGGWPARRRR